jgi:hypothetical protein
VIDLEVLIGGVEYSIGLEDVIYASLLTELLGLELSI